MKSVNIGMPGFTAEAVFSRAGKSSYSSGYFNQSAGMHNNIIVPQDCDCSGCTSGSVGGHKSKICTSCVCTPD